MIAPVPVRVECHSGHKGEEYPVAVHLEGQRREVTEIVDRWYQGAPDPSYPAAEYFKVRAAEGLLILKHDRAGQVWFLMCEL
jgi:hypothetical protein